jgi:hypothetical protein
MQKDTLHKLVEALKPFAEIAEDFSDASWGEDDRVDLLCDDWTVNDKLTVGDLRKAASVLDLLSKGGGVDAIPEPAIADGDPSPAVTDYSAPVERLTRATCTFAQHIDRDGVGWSRMRHDDVCAVLGRLEALESLNNILSEKLERRTLLVEELQSRELSPSTTAVRPSAHPEAAQVQIVFAGWREAPEPDEADVRRFEFVCVLSGACPDWKIGQVLNGAAELRLLGDGGSIAKVQP